MLTVALLVGLSSSLAVSAPRKVQLSAAPVKEPKPSDIGMRSEGREQARSVVRGKDEALSLVQKPAPKAFVVPAPPQSDALTNHVAALLEAAQTPTTTTTTAAATTAAPTAPPRSGVVADISTDRNWCRHLYAHLHADGDEKTKVAECAGMAADACVRSYQEVYNGTFQLCVVSAAGACEPEAFQHECPWTFLMEDLMHRHQQTNENCHGETLEAKRSLDGLLHAVQKIQTEIEFHNQIIQAQNVTIRDLLTEQQGFWATYLSKAEDCMEWARANWTAHVKTKMDELDILAAIADPDVRSAVNFQENEGYQEDSAGTQVNANRAAREAARGATTMPDALQNGASVAEVDVAEHGAGSSFLEQSAEQCMEMVSLIQKFEEKRKVKLFHSKAEPRECDNDRTKLTTLFHSAVLNISTAMNAANQTVFDERASCLSDATFEYKFLVEGRGQIDNKIQLAAQEIHQAQYHISVLEPRLHDVEHGSERMRTYIDGLRNECQIDQSVWNDLRNVQKLIQNLKECPGRNDFILQADTTIQPFATPAPTPWFQRTS